jgi:radical SAM protein with 4Fe4S-binding SPASM domain
MDPAAGRPAPSVPRRLRSADDEARHRPVHVVWEITLACNLRCGHCGSRAGRARSGELDTEECLDIVRQLAELGTREVSLIGGEAYLRRDWLAIAKAISDAGMHCGIQTGGRAFTEEKVRAAVEAGVRTIGVSVDGNREIHDRLRGVKGSFDQALKVLRSVAAAGISPGVNTQINALSKPHLTEIFETIVANGARFWQVQITVAMGNAVDNAAILLQPYEVPEVIETLAELHERGRRIGFRLIPGNNIGYYGKQEHVWRTMTSEPMYWTGCTAGETSLGLEADGKIKSCPSLPADPYSGGSSREVSIRDAIAALAPKTTRRDRSRGGGFCRSCYYWNVCRGGCTWITHGISGKRGDNPYCDYRARELGKKGLRERVRKVAEAPGEPFDFGRFEIVLENRDGRRVPKRLARDGKKRPRGRKLVLCPNCQEYRFASEARCPHCGAADRPVVQLDPNAGEAVRDLLDEIERHTQSIESILARMQDGAEPAAGSVASTPSTGQSNQPSR